MVYYSSSSTSRCSPAAGLIGMIPLSATTHAADAATCPRVEGEHISSQAALAYPAMERAGTVSVNGLAD